MKTRRSRSILMMLAAPCALAVLVLMVAGTRSSVARAAATGTQRPTLSVTTLTGGSFRLHAQRGKWVIINYWATWCSPCIQEMPALSAFVSSRHDVTAIGLAYEDTAPGQLRAFLRKHPVRYPVASIDPAHPPAGIAMPSVLPTTFLVAPDGHVARTFVGPLDMHELAAAIDGAKAGS